MIEEEKKAVKCGYVSIFRYNPVGEIFTLDYKEPDFSLYGEFLEGETRFSMLKAVNKEKSELLLTELKEDSIKKFEYYKSLVK